MGESPTTSSTEKQPVAVDYPALVAVVAEVFDRSDQVGEWPSDEAALHREWEGDFTSRGRALLDLRARKAVSFVLERAPHDRVCASLIPMHFHKPWPCDCWKAAAL